MSHQNKAILELPWSSSVAWGRKQETSITGTHCIGRRPAKGHATAARVLLEYEPGVNSRKYTNGTVLSLASSGAQLVVIRMLMEHGADAKAFNNKGATPLHCGSTAGGARVRLQPGANANAWDYGGGTLSHRALEWPSVEVAKVLLEHGIDVNSRYYIDQTPLRLASKAGVIDLVRFLLHSPDIYEQDRLGLALFQCASTYIDVKKWCSYYWNVVLKVHRRH